MKYGVFSDIHGNYEALKAVLDDMDSQGVEDYICLGDLVGYGSDPGAVLDTVRDLSSIIVAGNHDYGIAGYLSLSYFNRYAREVARWTQDQLSDEQLTFLSNLPLRDENSEAVFVHSTIESPELFEYVLTAYDAHVNLKKQTRTVSFHGHSHVPVNFLLNEAVSHNQDSVVSVGESKKAMVNPGSVGQPRDGDSRAAYAIYDSDEEKIEIRRVKYNIDKASEKIQKAGLPKILGERLYHGK